MDEPYCEGHFCWSKLHIFWEVEHTAWSFWAGEDEVLAEGGSSSCDDGVKGKSGCSGAASQPRVSIAKTIIGGASEQHPREHHSI